MAKLTRKQFIERIAPLAIADMKITNVAASLTIAQAVLESGDGNSSLTVKGNNLFGIKGIGAAGSVDLLTSEFVDGLYKKIVAKFRKYNSWEESIADHSALFINGVSWNKSLYHNVIGKNGIIAAREVSIAGYATDPKYAEKLFSIINENNLLQYDVLESDYDTMLNLIELVNKLHSKISDIETKLLEIPAPNWLIEEFPNSLELINQKTGTADFWRAYAITLRALNQFKNSYIQLGIK